MVLIAGVVLLAVTGAVAVALLGDDPPAANTAAPTAPAGLRATKTAIRSIVLTWEPGKPSTRTPDEFAVYRSEIEVGTTDGTTFTFEDSRLAPATRYEYSVVARAGSKESPASDTLRVKTRHPLCPLPAWTANGGFGTL